MNFAGLEDQYSGYKESDIVILPVPFDGTSTWVKGADMGPTAILQASQNMELYDIDTDSQVFIRGIHTARPVIQSSSEKMVNAVEEKVSQILMDGKFPLLIGGEHSVSIGAFHAVVKQFNELTILQLDAHADLRQEYDGSPLNHACVMARAREITDITQVGIRSISEEEKPYMNEDGIFFSRDICDSAELIQEIINTLNKNVYITLDLDVLDPSIMPSTGTPEPDGLNYRQVLDILISAIRYRNIVGMDVVELCPTKGLHAPNFLTAKLIYQFLSHRFNYEKNGSS
jgi:agmatinase